MIKNEFYNTNGNSRDMSRIELGRMVTNLRKELKEQINENKELEKKVDGLTTVLVLLKDYLNNSKKINRQDMFELLERVNENEEK